MSKGKQDILKVGTNEMELVDFRIFKQMGDRVYEGIYGVNVSKVREIIKIPKLTELPGAPSYIEGIFDLRGVVIPVVNLAKWMGIQMPENIKLKPRIIIAEFSEILVGFIVSEAKRIRRISWSDIEPATFSAGVGEGALDRSKVTGVTKIENDDVLLILDFESIVKDLGLYQPELETDIEVEKFSGTALILDDSSTARHIVKDALERMGLKTEAGRALRSLRREIDRPPEDHHQRRGDAQDGRLPLCRAGEGRPPVQGGPHRLQLLHQRPFQRPQGRRGRRRGLPCQIRRQRIYPGSGQGSPAPHQTVRKDGSYG